MNIKHALQESHYDINQCEIGVIHIGIGVFSRSHQAYYFDKLLEIDNNWAIAGVNLRQTANPIIEQLAKNNYQYVLKTIKPSGENNYHKIKAIKKIVNWHQHQAETLELFALNTANIVTITITEGGYIFHENYELNVNDEVIQNEINSSNINTIYGFLRIALNYRKSKLNKPISILSCDNIRNNGKVLERCFKTYLQFTNDYQLLEWVDKNVSFPSSMVDRITPKLNPQTSKEIEQKFNIQNDSTVMAEDYTQWVVENNFIADKPQLSKVKVQIVNSVHHFEETKIRILNGGHTAICYCGALQGYEYFSDTMQNQDLKQLLDTIISKEVVLGLPDNLPLDTTKYKNDIIERFSNTFIGDTIARICSDGVSKISIFILPTIKGCFQKNIIPKHMINVIATWYVFMENVKANKINFDYIDSQWHRIEPYVGANLEDKFIELQELWGILPNQFPEFKTTLKQCIIVNRSKYGK